MMRRRLFTALLCFLPLMGTAQQTVDSVLKGAGVEATAILEARFKTAGAPYPPREIALLGIKDSRKLELWARHGKRWKHIVDYGVLAASGGPGPKLREGDRQVPEGFYNIQYLNPNSKYHLSMKIDYPNSEDRRHARAEGRTKPGGDIFIHGRNVSIGCLAIGDPAIEELFTLVATIGRRKVTVMIAPGDPRIVPLKAREGDPAWLQDRYDRLTAAFSDFIRKPVQ